MLGTDKSPYVYFGAQIGGMSASHFVADHLTALSRLLRRHCDKRYVPDLNAIDPVFRIDGDTEHWDKEGLERLRLARKQKYVTVDIMMPRSRWEGKSEKEIRLFINGNFKNALHLMVNRLKKEHMEVDEDRLFKDYAKVEKEFMAFRDESNPAR